MKFYKLALLYVFLSSSAIAGPLGVDKGMSLEDLKKIGDFAPTENPNLYRAKSIKQGHPDVEFYFATLTPSQGLCKISAATKDIQSSSYGNELKEKFIEIKEALAQKYGSPDKDFDFLRSGSIWNESKDWMMGLYKKERYLTSFWTAPQNKLPNSIAAIKVEAIALGSSKGYVSFGYEFDNFDQCLSEKKAKSNANL
jgi:hypothetical protein